VVLARKGKKRGAAHITVARSQDRLAKLAGIDARPHQLPQ
jgi:hypothetical protein